MATGMVSDGETPASGQQVITACAFIHHSFDGIKKVFLPKRSQTKKFLPGVYELPGGHINFGENIVAGLKREILEEIGMPITVGDPFFVFTYTNNIKGAHSIEVDFFATFADSMNKITLNPHDHSEYGWFGEDELENALNKRNKNDPEFQAIKKGFLFLNGTYHNFGKP